MKRLSLNIILLVFTIVGYSQTSYKGGVGDGGDMAKFVFQNVGIEENRDKVFDIYPSILKPGESFNVSANFDSLTIQLVDLSGRKILLNGSNKFSLPNNLSSGMYSVLVTDIEKVYFAKIVVVD